MNPMKNRPNKITPRQVVDLDNYHRMNGIKVIPGRSEDKAQSMPAVFGRPGPKRVKHPFAPV